MTIRHLAHHVLALAALLSPLALCMCSDPPIPKPRGYFRITLPEHEYNSFESQLMPYKFDIAAISHVAKDHERGALDTWTNITYPTLNCKIHLTYISLATSQQDLAFEDSHQFAYKHTIMADAIGEQYYEDPERHVFATLYQIKGNAASPIQFAITDSAGQFFRGSLYFYCKPNKDSLAPVIDYVNQDINHLIETFNWTNRNATHKKDYRQ